jgi:hypothetical protein
MNANPKINEKWLKEIEADVATVDAKWLEWYGTLNAGPFNTDCLTWCWTSTCNCGASPQPMPPKVPPAAN